MFCFQFFTSSVQICQSKIVELTTVVSLKVSSLPVNLNVFSYSSLKSMSLGKHHNITR